MSYFEVYPLNAQNKAKHFIYKVEKGSYKRGYNRIILVYALIKHKPILIGENHVNTASYKGDKASANEIIAELYGYRFDGYNIIRKDITLFEV